MTEDFAAVHAMPKTGFSSQVSWLLLAMTIIIIIAKTAARLPNHRAYSSDWWHRWRLGVMRLVKVSIMVLLPRSVKAWSKVKFVAQRHLSDIRLLKLPHRSQHADLHCSLLAAKFPALFIVLTFLHSSRLPRTVTKTTTTTICFQVSCAHLCLICAQTR